MRNAPKCFLCFRPPPTLEIDDGVDCSADRMLSLFASARNSNRLINKPKKEKKSSPKEKTVEPSISDRHSSSRKSFSSVVKAVMLQTSLSRRVRDAKSRSRSDQSVESPPPTPDQTTAVEKSAIAINLKSESKQTNTSLVVPENKKRSGGGMAEMMMNPVVCLVLLSLCVTVFWGRVCAVMLTTVWIYAWQSGAIVVGLGEIVKRLMASSRRRKKMSVGGESEKETDTVTAKGNQLIERGCFRWN